MEENCSQNGTGNGSSTVRFVCPACFRRFEFPEAKVRGQPPLCPYCGVPLVRNRLGGETAKAVLVDSPRCKELRDQIDAEMARTYRKLARLKQSDSGETSQRGTKNVKKQ